MGGIAAGLLAFFGRKPSALAAALTASAIYAWPGKPFNFRDKAVVITGGSRGLGFALARNLVRTGAKVALIARDAQELESAKSQLGKDHTRLIAIPCDVTEASELENAVNEVAMRVKHSNAFTIFNVLPDEIEKQGGFAGATRADDVRVPGALFG